MVNYVCAKTVPDSTKLQWSKIKISQGNMPPDPPCLPHALHTDTYLPPNNPYNFILPHPLSKETLIHVHVDLYMGSIITTVRTVC